MKYMKVLMLVQHHQQKVKLVVEHHSTEIRVE